MVSYLGLERATTVVEQIRQAAVRLPVHRMHQDGELHRVLDEEQRDVVAGQVPVVFGGVALERKAAHIARGVHRAGTTGHGGEAAGHRRTHAGLGEHTGTGVPGQRVGQFEVTLCTAAARMHDALGNRLVIEVGDLPAQDEILQQGRATGSGLERVVVVGHRDAPVGGQLPVAATSVVVPVLLLVR